MQGKYAESVEVLAKMSELNSAPEIAKAVRESFAREGWKGFLRMIMREQGALDSFPYDKAIFLAALGERDQALVELNRAYDERDYFLPFLKIDPRLDTLHGDPRFEELLRKIGFPQ